LKQPGLVGVFRISFLANDGVGELVVVFVMFLLNSMNPGNAELAAGGVAFLLSLLLNAGIDSFGSTQKYIRFSRVIPVHTAGIYEVVN
jgi:hypothetical protein